MSIKSPFKKVTTALVTATALQGCADLGKIPLGKEGGQILGGAVGAVLGEAAGQSIDDNRLRTVITAGATAGGVAIGGAIGSQQTICDGGETTTSREASRNNSNGDVTQDTTRQTSTESCDGGDYVAPTQPGSKGNTPIF